jgi:hypothetical protein
LDKVRVHRGRGSGFVCASMVGKASECMWLQLHCLWGLWDSAVWGQGK